MKGIVRTVAALACVAAALAALPMQAHAGRRGHDGRGTIHASSPSVFPPPRDPWRDWGVRSELPHRVGPPRFHHGARVGNSAPRAVWVPAQWVWDGFTWVWVAGHWVR
jgi:hypothetical protein